MQSCGGATGALEEHDLPDLLLVDGAYDSVQFLRVLDELGITDLEVAGIAKSRLKETSRLARGSTGRKTLPARPQECCDVSCQLPGPLPATGA